ncbi:MAG: Anticodon-binding domain of tRNA, variant 4 [Marteilia pararefringens]
MSRNSIEIKKMSYLLREFGSTKKIPINLNYKICREIEKFWNRKCRTENSKRQSSEKLGDSDRTKYILAMFPYPSGNLHMGHARVYYNAAIHSDYWKLRGHEVIFPIGWDSFGLPAENAAIKQKICPNDWTNKNIEEMRSQFKSMNIEFDYSRELSTSNPKYYKWSQWLFLKLLEHNMAYRSLASSVWDPVDKTYLANEEINQDDSTSIRSGAKIEIKFSKQWFIRTSKYSKSLYDNLDYLPQVECDKIIRIQKSFLGLCHGFTTVVKLYLSDNNAVDIPIFFHSLECIPLKEWQIIVSDLCQIYEIEDIRKRLIAGDLFVKDTLYGNWHRMIYKSSRQLKYDYPSQHLYHDARIPFIHPDESYNGSDSNAKIILNTNFVHENLIQVDQSVKSRDWLVSRQRSWGTPIPTLNCTSCGVVAYPENQLPVERNDPYDIPCFKCGLMSKRETDTLDTFFDSSWYYFRFLDRDNETEIFDRSKMRPVDVYFGGEDHGNSYLEF